MPDPHLLDTYISVDVETAGPVPSRYSLLSIGACLVENPDLVFYVELKPVTLDAEPGALSVHNLSMERLVREGIPPAQAMRQFEDWLSAVIAENSRPVFVAFNAAFDWMFVADYFHRFLGRNPFGHSALDVKSLYMGVTGQPWSRTSMRYVSPHLLDDRKLLHHALEDAQDQAELFRQLLNRLSEPE